MVEKPKEEVEGDNSSARKSKKGKKGGKKKVIHGILLASSSKNLEEMKNDGTVPTVLVKESNESVDLMKQADEKLKQVLEMLVPSRRNSSVKSKTSSQRSKSSNYSIKNKLVQQAAVQVK